MSEAEDWLGCFVQNIATPKAKDIVDETFDSILDKGKTMSKMKVTLF